MVVVRPLLLLLMVASLGRRRLLTSCRWWCLRRLTGSLAVHRLTGSRSLQQPPCTPHHQLGCPCALWVSHEPSVVGPVVHLRLSW